MNDFKETTRMPRIITKAITEKQFSNLRIYGIQKMKFTIWTTLIGFLIFGCLELYFGLFPFLWDAATCIFKNSNELLNSLLFVFILSIYTTFKLIPALVYEKCILETEYNNIQEISIMEFIYINIKKLIINQIYLLPITYMVMMIIAFGGKFTIFFVWLLVAAISLIIFTLLPFIIEPIFFKYTNDIPDTFLEEIFKVADIVLFPISRIYILKTGFSYTCGNAYYSGIACMKKIVIVDTLLLNRGRTSQTRDTGKGLNKHQVAAVVAHELGHWNGCHYIIEVVLMQIHLLLCVVFVGLLFEYREIYEAVGFEPGERPIIVGLIVTLWYIITPYTRLANFAMLLILRRFEYSADAFAHSLGYSKELKSALFKMYKDCPSWPLFDSLYYKFYKTHPTILQRLFNLTQLDDAV